MNSFRSVDRWKTCRWKKNGCVRERVLDDGHLCQGATDNDAEKKKRKKRTRQLNARRERRKGMDELGDGSHDDSKHVGVDGTGEAGGERKRNEISWRLKEAEGEEKMRELTGSKPPSTSDGSVAGTSSGRTLVPGTQ